MKTDMNPDLPFLVGHNEKGTKDGPDFPVLPDREVTKHGITVYVTERVDKMSKAVAEVNERYKIPAEAEEQTAILVQNYLRASHNLEKAYERWQGQRGSCGFDVEFQLILEGQDLTGIFRSLREFDVAACELGEFLAAHDVRVGNKRQAHWMKEATLDFDPVKLDS